MAERERPISIAMLALGGQGGGVLTTWLTEMAEANGYLAQSTYVAGVAQRTGATVYCVELFPAERAAALGKEPVFTPYPVPGDVDLVIAGEMAETGRAILKGFVTPNITTLISSSHRVYSIEEKSAQDDGIVDQSGVAGIASSVSKRFVCFDMQAAADESRSIVSSVLFGAIAGSGVLPFEREAFEGTIRNGGRAVDANLRGFAAGFDGASAGREPAQPDEPPIAQPGGPNGEALAARIDAELPESVRNVSLHGALRALDYQDVAYANEYLETLTDVAERDDAGRNYALTNEVARQLALQMCYEDTVRVAELKTRRTRFDRIRQHVGAAPEQPVRVIEYMHPRIEEVCDTLPAWLGSWIMSSKGMRKVLAPMFRKGRNVRTTSLSGFLMLHLLTKLKRFRRGSYRFGRQQVLIRDWLDDVKAAAASDYDDAVSAARSIEAVRGYGDTYDRGMKRYRATG